MAARQLGKSDRRSRWRHWKFHRDDQFAGLQVGFEQALEEILGLHLALAGQAAEHQGRAERHRAGRQFGRRIGVGEAAAERAAVADRDMADMRRGLAQQRKMLADQIGREQFAVPRQRAEPHRAVGVRLAAQLLEVADVDQELRRRQPHVETGEQTLAAGDRHGFAAGVRQHLIGVRQRRRPEIAEVPGLHTIRSTDTPRQSISYSRSTTGGRL